MKIVMKEEYVPTSFDEIGFGECFEFGGLVYMKCRKRVFDEQSNAVCLSDSTLAWFDAGEIECRMLNMEAVQK